MDHNHYTYRVSWSPEDEEYVAQCAEFQSLSFLADTQEEALKGITDLVHDVIKDMTDNNESIPAPFSERKYTGKFQLRIPPELHRDLVIKSAEENVSLNRYISSKL
ncbi:MAG: toxin-antitoxin system HicB family antitoxin [Simkaniaceae bacterium]|nr:toxin-antitoxin system HicB family antitoxin [Simkaniaceae bacterium]